VSRFAKHRRGYQTPPLRFKQTSATLDMFSSRCPSALTLDLPVPLQVYIDADLMKNEGDVLRDAERALLLARGRRLDSYANVEAAADLVWDETQVYSQLFYCCNHQWTRGHNMHMLCIASVRVEARVMLSVSSAAI